MTRPVTTPPSGDQALALLLKVRRDTKLPEPVRRRAGLVAGPAPEPALVLASLQSSARALLPTLPRTDPAESLARVTTAATFLRYYSTPEARDSFQSVDDFLVFIATHHDPSAFLLSILTRNDPIFGWDRSWMAPSRQLRGLSAEDVLRALEMVGKGPLIVFEFDRDALLASGVQTRTPNSLDSVLGPNYQWRETGLASGIPEYVDGDLPRSALSRLSWRN